MLKQLTFVLLLSITCFAQQVKIPQIEFSPKKYVCYHTNEPLTVNGYLNESAWTKAEWTNDFADIQGSQKPTPRFRTRAKMLWDDKYLYIAAEIEDQDIWGTLKNHDDIIYNNNAFEIFVDPDGDTHEYCEIEINALNTIWDLILLKPYRDIKNAAISGWDIKGLKSSLIINGTLNKPNDIDQSWTLEVAIPWNAFKDISDVVLPPKDQDQWRLNFLRVEWQPELVDGSYQKKINRETGKPYSPDYWTWSPQGIINMHYPEMWGYVQFSTEIAGSNKTCFVEKQEEAAKWFLRQLYYSERNYSDKFGEFTPDLKKLELKEQSIHGYSTPPNIECTKNMFEASLLSDDNAMKISIRNDGLIQIVPLKK